MEIVKIEVCVVFFVCNEVCVVSWTLQKGQKGQKEWKPPLVAMNEYDILQHLDSLNFPVMNKHPWKIIKESELSIRPREISFKLPY